MITYLGKFIPNLTEETRILRDLEKKNIVWLWTENHQKEFDKIKKLITDTALLRYYDCNKELTI